MAISFVGANIGRTSTPGNTSCSVSKPAGVQAGDLIVLIQSSQVSVSSVPSGFTVRLNAEQGLVGIRVYTKTATASEPASYTTSTASVDEQALACHVYRGVDTTAPVGVVDADWFGFPSSPLVAPTATTTVDGAMVVRAYTTILKVTFGSAPAGTTQRTKADGSLANADNHPSLFTADALQATAGATGTAALSYTGDPDDAFTLTFTLQPGAATSAADWWDGATRQPANLRGWWNGTSIQPATLKGWWDGTTIRPISN